MSIVERDPGETGYIALYIALKWYKYIDSEAALRIVRGQSTAKPGRKLTPEISEQIDKNIDSINFKNFNSVERKFKINRYEYMISEEVFSMGQIDMLLKRLQIQAEGCNGNCSQCILNTEVSDKLTMCEFFTDIDLKNPKKPVNRQVRKSAIKCDLTGPTIKRSFEIYSGIMEEFTNYLRDNRDKKIRDIINKALVEYMERHKSVGKM
jgi:hypothetical protein